MKNSIPSRAARAMSNEPCQCEMSMPKIGMRQCLLSRAGQGADDLPASTAEKCADDGGGSGPGDDLLLDLADAGLVVVEGFLMAGERGRHCAEVRSEERRVGRGRR